jgi:hypothetical protein
LILALPHMVPLGEIATQHDGKSRPRKFTMAFRDGDQMAQPPRNSLKCVWTYCFASGGVPDQSRRAPRPNPSGHSASLQGVLQINPGGPLVHPKPSRHSVLASGGVPDQSRRSPRPNPDRLDTVPCFRECPRSIQEGP